MDAGDLTCRRQYRLARLRRELERPSGGRTADSDVAVGEQRQQRFSFTASAKLTVGRAEQSMLPISSTPVPFLCRPTVKRRGPSEFRDELLNRDVR